MVPTNWEHYRIAGARSRLTSMLNPAARRRQVRASCLLPLRRARRPSGRERHRQPGRQGEFLVLPRSASPRMVLDDGTDGLGRRCPNLVLLINPVPVPITVICHSSQRWIGQNRFANVGGSARALLNSRPRVGFWRGCPHSIANGRPVRLKPYDDWNDREFGKQNATDKPDE